MPDQMPDRMSGSMSEEMPGRIPERMSDRMSEQVPGKSQTDCRKYVRTVSQWRQIEECSKKDNLPETFPVSFLAERTFSKI